MNSIVSSALDVASATLLPASKPSADPHGHGPAKANDAAGWQTAGLAVGAFTLYYAATRYILQRPNMMHLMHSQFAPQKRFSYPEGDFLVRTLAGSKYINDMHSIAELREDISGIGVRIGLAARALSGTHNCVTAR